MNNKTVGVIGAMSCEVAKLKSLLKNAEEIKQGSLIFYKGEMYGKTVIVVKSGVGKVCGAVCTQILADKFHPDCIINTGIAGALESGLQIGDIVAAEKLVQHDFDATAIGYAKGYICNDVNPQEPTYFYADKKLLETFIKVVSEKMPNLKCKKGVIASGDFFVGSNEKKKEIHNMFNATAAEMEGAAIAHAATLNEIPFLVIRAISDTADENAGKEHSFNEETSADISAAVVDTLIKNI